MMATFSLSLSLIGILLSSCNGAYFGVPTYPLDQSTASVTDEEGTCTDQEICTRLHGDNLTCTECTPFIFQSSNVFDGNSSTKWVSNPSFINPSLTISFGQVRP